MLARQSSLEVKEQRYKRRGEGLHSNSQAEGAKTGTSWASTTSKTGREKKVGMQT